MESKFSISKQISFDQVRQEANNSLRKAFGFDFDTLVKNKQQEESYALSDSVERAIIKWNKSWKLFEAFVEVFDNQNHHFEFIEHEYHRKNKKASWELQVITNNNLSFQTTISIYPFYKDLEIGTKLTAMTVEYKNSMAQTRLPCATKSNNFEKIFDDLFNEVCSKSKSK